MELSDRDYLMRAKCDDPESIQHLLTRCEKIISSLVRRHFVSYYGIPEEDLIHEGQRGVLKAIRHFDLASHNQFTTYAYIWIKHFICQGVKANTCQYDKPAPTIKFEFQPADETFDLGPLSEDLTDLSPTEKSFLETYCSRKLMGGKKAIGALDTAARRTGLNRIEACMLVKKVRDRLRYRGQEGHA